MSTNRLYLVSDKESPVLSRRLTRVTDKFLGKIVEYSGHVYRTDGHAGNGCIWLRSADPNVPAPSAGRFVFHTHLTIVGSYTGKYTRYGTYTPSR